MIRSGFLRALWVLVPLAVAACAGVSRRADPPQLRLLDLRLVDATLLAQRYRLQLDLQNPNPFDLAVDGMSYELLVNDRPFVSGVGNRIGTVPAYGSRTVEVEAVGSLADVIGQFTALQGTQPQSFRYRLRGQVSVSGGSQRLPFDERGEIALVPQQLQRP